MKQRGVDGEMHDLYDVYEYRGMYFFELQHGASCGPYSDKDKAEYDSAGAEAMES